MADTLDAMRMLPTAQNAAAAAQDLVGHQTEIANREQQTQNMQQQSQALKADHSVALLKTFSQMNPRFRKQALETIKGQSRTAGVPMDALFDSLANDEAFTQDVGAIIASPEGAKMLKENPEQLLMTLSSTNPMDWQQGVNSLREMVKEKAAYQKALDVAGVQGASRVKASEAVAGGKSDMRIQRESERITNAVKKPQANIDRLDGDLQTITDGKEKGLDVSVLQELATSAASILSGTGATSEGQRDKLELNDVITKIKSLQNKFTKGRNKIKYQDDPQLFDDLEHQMSRLREISVRNLHRTADAKRVTYGNQAINDAQEQVIQGLKAQYNNDSTSHASPSALPKAQHDSLVVAAKKHADKGAASVSDSLKKAGVNDEAAIAAILKEAGVK
jgi:hypothetical protein